MSDGMARPCAAPNLDWSHSLEGSIHGGFQGGTVVSKVARLLGRREKCTRRSEAQLESSFPHFYDSIVVLLLHNRCAYRYTTQKTGAIL